MRCNYSILSAVEPVENPGFAEWGGRGQMNFFSDLGTLTGNTLTKSKNTTYGDEASG